MAKKINIVEALTKLPNAVVLSAFGPSSVMYKDIWTLHKKSVTSMQVRSLPSSGEILNEANDVKTNMIRGA